MSELLVSEIENLVARSSSAKRAEDEGKPYVLIPGDTKLENVEGLLLRPVRKTGCPQFTRSNSFCEYVNEQKEAESRLYVTGPTTVLAIINHHAHQEDEPGWGDHRASFQLTKTAEWCVWNNSNGKNMDQRTFAQFLDDNSEDIASPAGSELLELVRTIKASQRLELSGEVNEKNELTGSTFSLLGQTKVGAKEEVELPGEFTLSIAPYEGSEKLPVRARLRFQINNAKLSLSYELVKVAKIERQALENIVKGIEEAVEMTAWYGQP